MAISTQNTFLMKSADGTVYTKLVDIKSFPDLGGAPEMLETTTLSDHMQTYISGIQSLDALEFEANYTLTDFQTLNALAGEDTKFSVWLDGAEAGANATPAGAQGKYDFTGQLSVFIVGGGVNEPVSMTITIAPSTPVTLNTTTTP